MQDTIEQDISRVISSINISRFADKTVLVTGGTGLIGRTLVPALAGMGVDAVLLVRSEEKGRKLYGDSVRYVVGTVEDMPVISENLDYMIHMAYPTSSLFFIKKPVETIDIAVRGMKNILDLAKTKEIDSLVFLSSMEVYGLPARGHLVAEHEVAGFDIRSPRNSYPISKILCETMCNAYAKEYGVPARIVRLTQTFGPGVGYDDKRVFAEFLRCVIEKKNIVLHTKGETERCYLYTADAVSAIIKVLLDGVNGEVYNAANPETYCSIKEMADCAAKMGNVSVDFLIDDVQRGYAGTLYMNLDISKLESLGWKPQICLEDMFSRMISYYCDRQGKNLL